jgi:hypothetical protein
VFTKSPATASTIEARREVRAKAERRWRRAQQLPKLCGIVVLATIGFLAILPLLQVQPFAPLIAGCATLISVLAMMTTNLYHRSAFMAVQKSRGISDHVAESAYALERPFA